jgi:hypothetical protein
VQFFLKFNPENNKAVRATLYVIGCGGALHFASLFIIALKEHNWVWFNPLFAIDMDRVFPGLKNNYLTFFGGWLLLAIGAYVIFKILERKKH